MNERNTASPRFTSRAHAAALILLPASALACSADTVTMGEDGSGSAALSASSLCRENTTLVGDASVQSPEDLSTLEGCEIIEGDLSIEGAGISALNALHALRLVRGELGIRTLVGPDESEPLLRSLEGLESLESVGDLRLQGLIAENVDPLSNLTTLTDGWLFVRDCPNLTNLDGLSQLRGVAQLNVDAPSLESLPPIEYSEELTHFSISGARLSQLPAIGSNNLALLFISNTALPNLDAFSEVGLATEIRIDGNPELADIDGLDGLQAAEYLVVSNNPSLTRLPEFPVLGRLNSLTVQNNDRLASLSAFAALDPHGMRLTDELEWPEPRPEAVIIGDNAVLTSVALPPSWRGGSTLMIYDNPALTQIEFTAQLNFDRLSITDNPALTSVEVGALDAVDTLEVRDNPLLDASAFDAVRTFRTIIERNASQP